MGVNIPPLNEFKDGGLNIPPLVKTKDGGISLVSAILIYETMAGLSSFFSVFFIIGSPEANLYSIPKILSKNQITPKTTKRITPKVRRESRYLGSIAFSFGQTSEN